MGAEQSAIKLHQTSAAILYSNKQYHGKGLLNSFHLAGQTFGSYQQSEKLEPPYKV